MSDLAAVGILAAAAFVMTVAAIVGLKRVGYW